MSAILNWKHLQPGPALWVSVASVAGALAAGMGMVMLMGVPVGDAIAAFADGAWGSPYALAASINRALVLMLVGLGFVLAERANLTNVGGEGQIAVGGIAATALCLWPPVACFAVRAGLHRADAGRMPGGGILGLVLRAC